MNEPPWQTLRNLLQARSVMALGTLDEGEPYVSMVPFAIAPGGKGLVIHTSALAAHTRNMQRHDRVSALVCEEERSGKMAQALARATILGTAREIGPDQGRYATCREAYLERFPDARPMFDLADFRLFLIEVASARVVAGFAQAATLAAEQFAAAFAPRTGEG